jgi:hypothetical protein
MQIGDTFYWKDGGHLWVIISDPNRTGDIRIAVNVTRDLFRAGRECELQPGDHVWIKAKSYVSFGDAMKISAKEYSNLEKNIASGMICQHVAVTAAILKKIIYAAKKSKALSPDYLQYL